jgi:hypothetical protein
MTLPLLLIVTVIMVTAGWLGHSWWFPYTSCRWCKGRTGRGAGSGRGAYNRCFWCKGNPERVRMGARLINKATGLPVRGQKG